MSAFFEDYLELREFAAEVKRHPRSVVRWIEKDGFPYTKVGNRVLIHIPTARAWLAKRTRQQRTRKRLRGGNSIG